MAEGKCNPSEVLEAPLLAAAAGKEVAAWRVLVVLCGVAFTSNVIISFIAPILPLQYRMLGISQVWCGVMFASFPLATLVSSPITVKAMARYGRVPVLFMGLLLQGVTSITFGYADEITGGPNANVSAALTVYLLSRMLSGCGSSAANNAIFSIAADRFPTSLSKVMGLNEVVIGAGFTLGPPIGTALYLQCGFGPAFLCVGLLMLLFAPCSLLLRPPRLQRGPSQARVDPSKDLEGGLMEVLTPGLLCAGLSSLFGVGVFGVVEPILGLYLSDEVGVRRAAVGGMFAALSFSYSLAGPLAGALADYLTAPPVCAVGGLFAGLVMMFLMGPTASLLPKGSTERIVYEIVVLLILGIGQALTLIPTLPAMKDSVKLESEGTTEKVVAWFNMFMQLGLTLGPLMGSGLQQYFGFEGAVAIYGSIAALYGVAATAYTCSHRGVHSVADASPAHLITGIPVEPMSPSQRKQLGEQVQRQISF